MEKPREPGSAKHGNFINYYRFNPPERRLQLIPKNLLAQSCPLLTNKAEILALDVGCNSGDLTRAVYNHLTTADHLPSPSPRSPLSLNDPSSPSPRRPVLHILGIDSDPVLVQRCRENHEYPDTVSFQHADITSPADRNTTISDYLRARGAERFDVVFLFSVTMWLHLNNGDEGLRDVLKYLASVATYVVVEPQPWKCYGAAVRRMRKLTCTPFEHFPTLKWRENVEEEIVKYLEREGGMRLVEKFGRTEWDRSLCLFESSND